MKRSIPFLGIVILLCLSVSSQAFGQVLKVPKKTPELLTEGKKLYEQNCLPCHGVKGDGKGPAGTAIQPHPNDFTQPLNLWPVTKGSPPKIFEVISKGIPNTAMVKWDHLPEKGRWGLTYHVMEFASKTKAPPAKKK
jgi:mono/diheme cytochrome c family protein